MSTCQLIKKRSSHHNDQENDANCRGAVAKATKLDNCHHATHTMTTIYDRQQNVTSTTTTQKTNNDNLLGKNEEFHHRHRVCVERLEMRFHFDIGNSPVYNNIEQNKKERAYE